MAAIDYGVLIIKDGKVINTDLFPVFTIDGYTIDFYKYSLTIYKDNKLVESYFFGDKFSYTLTSAVGKIKVRTLSHRNRRRFITKIDEYTIIFGYGIDPDKHKGYQKHIMNDYGFDKREKRIISNCLWE